MDIPNFGNSSLLFIISYIHACIKLKYMVGWKLSLFLMPIASYLCNMFPNNILYHKFDLSSILFISLNYLYYNKKNKQALFILLLYLYEILFTKHIIYSKNIGFILLNYNAYNIFNVKQRIICMITFIISLYCFLIRKKHMKYYKHYTIIWHIGNNISLCLATISLKKLESI